MENLLYEVVEKAKKYDELTQFPNNTLKCDFCGKHQEQVRKLIQSTNRSYICDECVQLCNELLAEEFGEQLEEVKEEEK